MYLEWNIDDLKDDAKLISILCILWVCYSISSTFLFQLSEKNSVTISWWCCRKECTEDRLFVVHAAHLGPIIDTAPDRLNWPEQSLDAEPGISPEHHQV